MENNENQKIPYENHETHQNSMFSQQILMKIIKNIEFHIREFVQSTQNIKIIQVDNKVIKSHPIIMKIIKSIRKS